MSKGSAAWDQSSAWESGLVTTVHTVGSRNALQKTCTGDGLDRLRSSYAVGFPTPPPEPQLSDS